MNTLRVDVAVIGAGTAGLAARREARKAGASVVLIEGGPYGTTCARVGCMPSKLLIAAADAAHRVQQAGRFGIRVPDGVRVDGRAVLERVRSERDRFVGFVLQSVDAIPEAERLRGHARFVGPTTLRVDDHTEVAARAVVIATGAHATIPPALHAVRDRVMISDDVFELPDLPPSLAVIGTGVAGLELGQALHRLGVRTTFFSRSRSLGPISDPEVQAVVEAHFQHQLDLHLECEPDVSFSDDSGFLLRWSDDHGVAQQAHVAAVLAATGRVANLGELDLDRAGITGLPVANPSTAQIGDLPIFLAGDATAYRPLLHEASDSGAIAGRNAARFPDVQPCRRRLPLEIVFTDPNMAVVGKPYRELPRDGVASGAASYDDQGRARVMGENVGLVRIYARREDGVLIGAEMFGPRVEHTAHLLAWVMQCGLTVNEVLDLPYYHPVIEEGIRTAVRDLCASLRIRPPEKPRDMECGPGA